MANTSSPHAAADQITAPTLNTAASHGGTPAHLAGASYIINQRSDGKFMLKIWDPAQSQWIESEVADYASALAHVEGG